MRILTFAAGLRQGGGVAVRIATDDGIRDRARDREAVAPLELGGERGDDVEPLAAGRLDEARDAERREHVAHQARGGDDGRPRHRRAGVEVEHHAVRTLEVVRDRVPRVDLEHVHLHECQHARQMVGDEVFADLRLLRDPHPAEPWR